MRDLANGKKLLFYDLAYVAPIIFRQNFFVMNFMTYM